METPLQNVPGRNTDDHGRAIARRWRHWHTCVAGDLDDMVPGLNEAADFQINQDLDAAHMGQGMMRYNENVHITCSFSRDPQGSARENARTPPSFSRDPQGSARENARTPHRLAATRRGARTPRSPASRC